MLEVHWLVFFADAEKIELVEHWVKDSLGTF